MFLTNLLIDLLLALYVVVCGLMGLVIMMQRSKQEGLGAAFGGGITESMWGAQTSQVLVKATVWLALFFFILSISLARLYTHRASVMDKTTPVYQDLLKSTPPPAVPFTAPVPATTAPMVPAAPASNAPAAATPAKAPAH